MQNFNEFLSNITEYYDNILSNKVRPLFDTEEKLQYSGKDLKDRIEALPNTVNPLIVAALEKVYAYNRGHSIRVQTPKDYFAHYKKERDSKKVIHDRFQSQVNNAQGETK